MTTMNVKDALEAAIEAVPPDKRGYGLRHRTAYREVSFSDLMTDLAPYIEAYLNLRTESLTTRLVGAEAACLAWEEKVRSGELVHCDDVKPMPEIAAQVVFAPLAEKAPRAAVVEEARELSSDEDTVLTPVHGGHVFAGTWEQFQRQQPVSCAACGMGLRGAPCLGWPSAGAGDALRRVVRAVTRDRDEGRKPNGPHELAVEHFAEAFNRLLDMIDAGKAPRDELCVSAQTAARGFLLLLNTQADELRALELALAASDPHKALRSFMAALPSTDTARERGPVEDAFARLDAAIDKHGGTVAIAAAAEELADVIRARLREVATFALAWRDTVRAHSETADALGNGDRARITFDIMRERDHQIAKGRGAAHDDARIWSDWLACLGELGQRVPDRRAWVKIGALAVAALERLARVERRPKADDITLTHSGRRRDEPTIEERIAREAARTSEPPIGLERLAEVSVEPAAEGCPCGAPDGTPHQAGPAHPPTIPAPAPDVELVQEVASAAAEHRDDVVLHALHVAGGAAAIGVGHVEPAMPTFFDCGCSHLKVKTGLCDIFDEQGRERGPAPRSHAERREGGR